MIYLTTLVPYGLFDNAFEGFVVLGLIVVVAILLIRK